MKVVAVILTIFAVQQTVAQSLQKDGVLDHGNSSWRKPTPLPYLREADIMWSKRIIRVLDMREKLNHPLYFPLERMAFRKSLMQTIYDAVKEGYFTCYSDEEFTGTLSKAEALAKLNPPPDTIEIEIVDKPGSFEKTVVKNEFNPADYKQFWIKEDWFFDKQRGVMDVRIVGICPIKEVKAEDGSIKGISAPFWLYFPECREVFANTEVFNRHNDEERRTLDDIFLKRMFSSYIRVESNVYGDRPINSYALGIDALLESERVKEQIFEWESDLWEY